MGGYTEVMSGLELTKPNKLKPFTKLKDSFNRSQTWLTSGFGVMSKNFLVDSFIIDVGQLCRKK